MQKFNKLWAALIGLCALLALRHFEVSIPGFDAVVLEMIVSALTALGVYQVENH